MSSLIFIIIFGGLSLIPISDDYRYYTVPAHNWTIGESKLYDDNGLDFYYMPWSLLITVPLHFLPDHLGQAILNLVSLFFIFFSVQTIVGKLVWWQWFLLLCNLFIVNLMFTVQWDALVLGGVAIAWWGVNRNNPWLCGTGIMLAATKPTNAILPLIIVIIYGLQHRNFKYFKRFFFIPFVLLVLSFLACGLDWPIRYFNFIKTYPPREYYNISIWKVFMQIGIPTWLILIICLMVISYFSWISYRRKADAITLATALVVNMVVSPYLVSYHLVGTSPALGWIFRKKWYWGAAIYLSMLIIFLGVADILKTPPIVIYPLLILIAMLILSSNKNNL